MVDFRQQRKAEELSQKITARWNGEQWNGLLNSFNKADLTAGWFRQVKQFLFENSDSSWDNLSAQHLLLEINNRKNYTKGELCALSFSVLENKEIFDDFLHFLPDAARKAVILLVWTSRCNRHQLEAAMGNSILNEMDQLRPELKLLKLEENYFSSSMYLDRKRRWNPDFFLPLPLRDIILEYVDKPEGYYIEPLQELQFPKDVHLFSAEADIFNELPRLLAYHQQGKIKYNMHGKPNPANIKRTAKNLNIREFDTEKSAFPTRTNMLAGLLYEYAETKTHLEEVVKVLFQEHFVWQQKYRQNLSARTPLYIFNFLKGSIDANDCDGYFNQYLKELLQKLSPGEWVTRTNYIRHLDYNRISTLPFLYGAERKLYINQENDYGFKDREYVDFKNARTWVNLPYANGLIFVLASLGILEIAYRTVNMDGEHGSDWFSEYDGLEAFRLTPLGAYALGLCDVYEASATLTTNKFILEEDALILRVEGDLSLIDVMLEQFMEKSSANRYVFNTGLFLGDCKNAGDIETKITLFKQTLQTPLPRFWQNYLDGLVANTKSLRRRQEFYVYQIDTANKELQRLLAQDPVLKSLVLKAEQFHVIVKTKELTKFRNRLKELGYLPFEGQ